MKTLAGIIAANTAVFGLWRVSFGNPTLERIMWRHFACSYTAIAHGKRVHTLLTSAFSHITLPHFGINMFMLWEFGRQILAPVNNRDAWYSRAVSQSKFVEYFRNNTSRGGPNRLQLDKFMLLYFSSAVVSSALSVVVSNFRGTPGGTIFFAGKMFVLSFVSRAHDGYFCVYCSVHDRRKWCCDGRLHRVLPALPRPRGAHSSVQLCCCIAIGFCN